MKKRSSTLFLNILLILSLIVPSNMVAAAERMNSSVDLYSESLDYTGTEVSADTTYIIKFKSSAKSNQTMSRQGVSSEKAFRRLPSLVTTRLTDEEVEQLRNDPNVAYIEKDSMVQKAGDTVTNNVYQIHAPEVHAQNMTGEGVKVAILDTGIDQESPELNIAGGVSFVPAESTDDLNGHGTAIAGIIGALKDDRGLIGVAPNASLYNVKVLNEFGIGSYSQVIQGIEWAIDNRVDIISMSFAGTEYSRALEEALQLAYDNGIVLVAAVGNEGANSVSYPARYASVIGVGAVDGGNQLASFSNRGSEVEFVAPGVSIPSLPVNSTDPYTSMSGTSMAVPHVAGVAAIIKSQNPSWSNNEIRQSLRSSAVSLGDPLLYGYGLVNAANAFKLENFPYSPSENYSDNQQIILPKVNLHTGKMGVSGAVYGANGTVTEQVYGDNSDSVTDSVYHVQAAAGEYPNDYDKVALNNVPLKVDQAPFNINNGNENISTLSGSLTIRNTDLTLPGRNGMGFTLSRAYDSSNAQFYDMDIAAKDIFHTRFYPYQHLTYDRKTTSDTISYAFDSVLYNAVLQSFYSPSPGQIVGNPIPFYRYFSDGAWLSYWSDWYTYGNIPSDQISDLQAGSLSTWKAEYINRKGLPIFYSEFYGPNYAGNYYREWSTLADPNTYAPLMHTTFLYTGYFNKTIEKTYTDNQFPIGKGWSWNISSIEFKNGKRYLHLADNGVYEIDGSNQLVGYPWKDLTFSSNGSVSVNGQTSSYLLKSLNNLYYYFNSEGKLLRMTDGYGNNIDFSYSYVGSYGAVLTGITDAIGNKISISYSSTNVTLTQGNQTVVYNKQSLYGKEFLASVVDPLGRKTSYDYSNSAAYFNLPSNTSANQPTYNPYGLLKTVTYPTSAVTAYEYQNVTRQMGPSGTNQAYRISKRYDQVGQTRSNQVTFTYSGDMGSDYDGSYSFSTTVDNGLTQTVFNNSKQYLNDTIPASFYTNSVVQQDKSSAAKQTTTMSYDTNRRLPVPNTTTVQYSKGSTSSPSSTTTRAYDDYGHVISSTNPLNVTTTTLYDPTTHWFTSSTQPIAGGKSLFTQVVARNAQGDPTETVIRENAANGSVMKHLLFSYDGYGNVVEIRDKDVNRDAVTQVEYSGLYGAAYPTKMTKPYRDRNGALKYQITQGEYDKATGVMTAYVDGNGNRTSYSYDLLNRIKGVTQPDGSTQSWSYDDAANQITHINEMGLKSLTKWNPLGLQIENGVWENGVYLKKASMGYDDKSRAIWTEDAAGARTTQSYDAFNRPTVTQAADSTTSRMEYDDVASTVTAYDAEGNASRATSDILGRQVKAEEAVSGGAYRNLFARVYDYAGNVTAQTDANGNTSSYAYDVLGRLVQSSTAMQETYRFEYDRFGNLTRQIDPSNQVRVKEYNEVNQVIRQTDPAGKASSFEYDGNGNRTVMVDRMGQAFSYTYSNRNLPLKKNGPTSQISYTYNLDGTRKSMADTTGTTGYGYTALGQLKQVTYPDGQTLAYQYDSRGNRSQMTAPFAAAQDYTYNQLSQLTNVKVNGVQEAAYSYYRNGILKGSTLGNGMTTSQTYTGLQLTGLQHKQANGTFTNSYGYGYDANKNIISRTAAGRTDTFTYDPDDRITTSSLFDEMYGYDSRSNRQTLASSQALDFADASYVYDEWDRLSQVTKDGKVISYRYNGDNLLTERTENGETTRYYYDGVNIVAEAKIVNGQPVKKANYVRGLSLINRVDASGAKGYYLLNGHGDVVELRDTAGNVLNTYSYDIWGNVLTETESVDNPFRYSGEFWDKSTSLQYLRARWYDPSVGRFMNEDTYEGDSRNPLSLNLYTYVQNNPLRYIDPTGHKIMVDNQGGASVPGIGYLPGDSTAFWNAIGLIAGFLFVDDINTLLNPDASVADKALSAAGFIPYGKVIKGGKMVIKFVSHGKEIERSVELTEDALKATKRLPCNCFTAGTKVQTDEGEKNIEDIDVGDRVLSKDDETGEIAYKEVEWLFQRDVEETYNITVDGEVITTTDEHPFWIVGEGWVKSKDLVVGDILTTSDGKKLDIGKIEIKREHRTVYNFKVMDFHTYFVSNLGIWTHNACSIGTNFGKQGILTDNPGIRVDWGNPTKHGFDRMLERGVSSDMVNDWVAKGKALSQDGGKKFLYVTQEGAAVVAKDGTLVTVMNKYDFDDNMQSIVNLLYGN